MDQYYAEEKLQLINYLHKNLKYKVGKHKQATATDTYLYNATADAFQIVRVNNSYQGSIKEFPRDNNALAALKTKMTITQKHLEIKVINIVLGDFLKNIDDSHAPDLVIFVGADGQSDLNQYFPTLKAHFDNQEIKIGSLNANELREQMGDSSSKLHQDFKRITHKLQPGNLLATWVIVILVVGVQLFLYLARNALGFGAADASSFALVFGGVTRDLLVGANQGGRLLVYPFVENNLVSLLIYGILFYIVIKYCEASFKAWQLVVTLVMGVGISAFLVSIAFPGQILYGLGTVVALMYGALFMMNYKKRTLTAHIVRTRTVFILIGLLIFPLFNSAYYLYLLYFVSFMTGFVFGFLFSYDYDHVDGTIGFPIVVLLCLIVTPIVLLLTNQYLPPNNINVFNTLQLYYNKKGMSQSAISRILENYYHIANPGSFIHF